MHERESVLDNTKDEVNEVGRARILPGEEDEKEILQLLEERKIGRKNLSDETEGPDVEPLLIFIDVEKDLETVYYLRKYLLYRKAQHLCLLINVATIQKQDLPPDIRGTPSAMTPRNEVVEGETNTFKVIRRFLDNWGQVSDMKSLLPKEFMFEGYDWEDGDDPVGQKIEDLLPMVADSFTDMFLGCTSSRR